MTELEERLMVARLELLELELQQRKIPKSKDPLWSNPLMLAIIGATATGIIGIGANKVQEKQKLESSLILKATEPANPAERAAALTFLVRAGLVSDHKGKILKLASSDGVPQISQGGEAILSIPEVPDLKNAKQYVGHLTTDFSTDGQSTIDTKDAPISGYFNVNIPPSNGSYAGASVQYNKEIKPHFFASVRLSGDANIKTLELQGLGIYFLLSNHDDSYYIWASEETEQKWKTLPIPKDEKINTLGLYQKDRYAVLFLNNKKVASFDILKSPDRGKVGLYFKANNKTGGTARFERLAVYEFSEEK